MLRTRVCLASAVVALVLSACALPSRDNPADPSNRPTAVIDVTVDGVAGSSGGRHSAWTLDASASSSTKGPILSYEWAVSTSSGSDATTLAYDVVGNAATISTTTATALHDRLAAVADFVPGAGEKPGTGITTRWVRLTIADGHGIATEYRLVTIVNHPPAVDLGPDLRVAPGGKWWTRTSDALSAEPWTVTLQARTSDPDPGDDALPFTAANPGRWTVVGPLAKLVDLDGDGVIDPAFVASNGRLARFPAPIVPSRSIVTCSVGDDGITTPAALSAGSVRVDVLTTVWELDDASALTRVDVSHFDAGIDRLAPVATDGRHIFSHDFDYNGTVSISDVNFVQLFHGPIDTTGPDQGVADGAGGWWGIRNNVGALDHYAGDTLAVDATDSTLFPTGLGGRPNRFVPIRGTSAIWTIGGATVTVNGATFVTDVLLVTTAGDTAINPFPNDAGAFLAGIAPDGAGGVYVGGTSLAHVLANGTLDQTFGEVAIPNDPAETLYPSSIVRNPVDGSLWMLLTSVYDPNVLLVRRDADGTMKTLPELGLVTLYADAEGVVDAFDSDSSFVRFAPDMSILSTSAFPHEDTGLLELEGGSILESSEITFSTRGARRGVVEAAAPPDGGVFVPLSPGAGQATAMAIDPVRGDLWIFRPDTGDLERRSAAGDLSASVHVADTLNMFEARSFLSIDRAHDRVVLGFSDQSPNGRILSIAIPDDPSATPTAVALPEGAPLELDSLFGVAATANGDVCLAGATGGGSTFLFGNLDAAGTFHDVPINGNFTVHGDESGCWFLDDATTQINVTHVGASGTTTFAVTDANALSALRGTAVTAAGNALLGFFSGASDDFVMSLTTDGTVSGSTYPVYYASGDTIKARSAGGVGISPPLEADWIPFYDHLILATSPTTTSSGDGGMIRFKLDARPVGVVARATAEAQRTGGFVDPMHIRTAH